MNVLNSRGFPRPSRKIQTPTGERVEFKYSCPRTCHGFGRCSVCNDTGSVWRRPQPFPAMDFGLF